ncbi:uncharacterized protein si:ch211-171b20.3 isoform X2 [Micropterus salmoides]|uniref:uncharacterized protein si:ch211-171b20.3 isoform X2 n=1 Tax=Micropterus salmoides TaxID=27706 RepID=UPI0018EDF355|nr:uncharacterized protein si:ch211-171b20.3 isoform X2 [Micropterus salmoides]
MTFQVNASLTLPTAKALISEGSSNCSQRGLDATGYPAFRNLRMGAGGRRAAMSHNNHIRRAFPVIQPLSSMRLERTRTVIPPLPRDYHVHRRGNLHPFSLSKELSHSLAGRPFTLGYPERYELNTSPAILFPSMLVLNGRNTFSVENCKFSRPKVNYPTHNLPTVDNQKSQSYPDPMLGASRSFIHRISELSSLEGETVRQEKLKKMRKPRKPPS